MVYKAVSGIDSSLEVVPGRIAGDGAIGGHDKAFWRGLQCGFSGLLDFRQAAAGDDAHAFHPAHVGAPEKAGYLGCTGVLAVRQFQAAVDHVSGIFQEAVQVSVRQVVVADVQDVKNARPVDLLHQGQVVRSDALIE